MAEKTNRPDKTFREVKDMESEFLLRLDRLDRITEELEGRVYKIGKKRRTGPAKNMC